MITQENKDARDIWSIAGSFGEVCGAVNYENGVFSNSGDAYLVTLAEEKDKRGVYSYTAKIRNTSDKPITVNYAGMKFISDGGEYDVYTQYNGWQNESIGRWQPLVTGILAVGNSLRATEDAAPFAVLWNNQNNRGWAFHVISYGTWSMKINRVHYDGISTVVETELGFDSKNLAVTLNPGEELELPRVIKYTVSDKVGLDCFKIHGYMNEKYPMKEMPVIYDTWLYKFDRISFENLESQLQRAKDIGVEYFVIDAGWFGKGKEWWTTRGDWDENMTAGFCGRMKEFADLVRKNDMKFGFWLEPETASAESYIIKQYPDHFLEYKGIYMTDFANPEAVDRIFNKTCELIDRYGAEFMKFDFNNEHRHDRTQSAFTDYFKGYMDYIRRIYNRYPGIYISDCASGGTRMALRDCIDFPSFWPTDNQSPVEGVRIVKDSILRMPANRIERWISIRSLTDFGPVYMSDGTTEKILSTNDATWDGIIGVEENWLYAFMAGGVPGLTFDLNSLSDEVYCGLKEFISEFKAKREFYMNAVCRVLCDTDTMTVLQYSDEALAKSEVYVFPKMTLQNSLTIYPAVTDGKYEVNGEKISSADIAENGITVKIRDKFKAEKIILKKL